MFFGKPESETIRADAAYSLLNSLFEKKLGTFASRAERTTAEMLKAVSAFSEACDKLEKLEAEPYVENIYFKTVASIKSQKYPYVKTLRDILGENPLESGEASNSYERYRELLSNVEKMITEVLKANAEYKLILYCYGNYMGTFRQSFSNIERSRDALKREIESKSKEASEFNSLDSWLQRIASQQAEHETILKNIALLKESLDPARTGALENDEAELAKRLNDTKSELSAVEAEIAKLSGRISLLTTPLQRPARKMDHISLGKKQLHPLIEDPISNIKTEVEYAEFKALVKQLKDDVEKGNIDPKNRAGTLDAISLLLNENLYSLIQSLKSLRQKRLDVEYEVKATERTLIDVKEGKSSSERRAHDAVALEEKVSETKSSIESAKNTAEKLFLEYYRKSVSITL